jgi:hypothetical protein
MDGDDWLTTALVLIDVGLIVLAGLAGFLVDLARPGRRWTRWRVSARSVAFLCATVVGTAGLVVVPIMLLALGVPKTVVAPAGMGPWVLAIGGVACFTVSRRFDRKTRSAHQPEERP